VPGIIVDEHVWMICGELEEFVHVGRATKWIHKIPCILCLWDRRACQEHWTKESWPKREGFEIGERNIIGLHSPLVYPN